jgi:hypothetical protein
VRAGLPFGFNGVDMAMADGRRTWRSGFLVGSVACVTVSCAGGETTAPRVVQIPETVAIGGMPGPLSDTTVPTLPAVTLDSTTTTEAEREPITGPLVDEVLGSRVLLIGDTALAATTSRAGGIMCDVVTGFGWDVEIEAEPGRSIAFAGEVLDELLDDDWDVVGLMFGHHVDDTVDDFERTLDDVLARLDPRPVILATVAELGDEQAAINRVLRERQRSRPNVVILEWAEATALEPEVLLDEGGPVPSDEGAGRLALFTAALLSRYPGDDPGTCLESVFTDDSAIVL